MGQNGGGEEAKVEVEERRREKKREMKFFEEKKTFSKKRKKRTDSFDRALRVDALNVPRRVVPDEDAVDAVLAALAAALEEWEGGGVGERKEKQKRGKVSFFFPLERERKQPQKKLQKKRNSKNFSSTHPARRVVERLPVEVPQVVPDGVGRLRVEQRPRVARPVVPPRHPEERRRGGLLGREGLVLSVLGGASADAVLVPVELLACE